MSKKVLVTYFSASGVTEQAAETLAKTIGADIHEIEPKDIYTNADLNWNNPMSRSCVEMNDLTFRPEMVESKVDIASYDEILIGFPVWWGIAPTIINTFIEHYDFAGKVVRAFATSGGSGLGNCERSLKKQYPNLNWEPGKLLNSQRDIKAFAKVIK